MGICFIEDTHLHGGYGQQSWGKDSMSCPNINISCLWMCFANVKNFSFLGLHHHSRYLYNLVKVWVAHTNPINPGISGSTQRERNYESPAAHTFSSENSCSIINNICLFRNQLTLLIAYSQSLKVAYHLQKIQAFS